MNEITVAALQLGLSDDIAANIAAVTALVREAAAKGAQVILPPELFEGHYFCQVEDERLFARARPIERHAAVAAMRALAAEAYGPPHLEPADEAALRDEYAALMGPPAV